MQRLIDVARFRLDCGDACSNGPAAAPGDDSLDELGFTLHERLDRAIAAIADPASHAERLGDFGHRVAIADTLHAAANHEVLRDHGLGRARRRV